MPFSDEELDRIRKACDNAHRPLHQRKRSPGHVGCEYKNAQGSGAWTGEDVKDLIELMLHTGFRISDATLFDMNRSQGNNVMIRAQKNGYHVSAWLPDRIAVLVNRVGGTLCAVRDSCAESAEACRTLQLSASRAVTGPGVWS
jgi:hypothetical protein